MTKEIKNRLIEIGLGAVLYVYAIFVCEFRGMSGLTELIIYIVAWIVLIAGICKDMVSNIRKSQFFDENLLILLATIGAFVIEKYPEAVGAALFFQLGVLIEKIAVNNTKKSISKYMNIRPDFANLKVDEEETKIVHPRILDKGQKIVIKPGEKIPVDAVVIKGTGSVDMKALTGETMPKEVGPGRKLYSGSINLTSVLEARVESLYEESTASKVMDLVEEAAKKKSISEGFAEKFRRWYTPIVTILGVMVMLLPPMLVEGHDPEEWLYRGMVFFVAACPIGLLVSVPIAFLSGIGAASKQGVLIKGSNYLEALSMAETFVFDKTGTLTEGVFKVKEITTVDLSPKELLEITALAEVYSTHPIAMSLRRAFGKHLDESRVTDVEEHSGFGVSASVDGEKIYVGNSKLMDKFEFHYPSVKAVGTVVYVAIEGEYAGYILIGDEIRHGVKRLIRWLHKHDIETVMLTGDNKILAKATAKQLGIHYVHANLMPEDKVEYLEEFIESQREDEKLVFVGDGINDAPVLARADIGIAMGGLGSDAALEAADIILMKDEPARIVNAIRISKATVNAVKQNMWFAIGLKVFMLILALFGFLTMQNAIIADMCMMAINVLNSYWVLKYPE